MNRRLILACAIALSSTPAFATTATSFSSFGGVEEPTVIYHVSSKSFTTDSYDNTTSPSSGTFHFALRYRPNNWWDGDRDTTSTDRQ